MKSPDETPYTILGLTPAATPAAIQAAYAEALRLRRYPVQKIVSAFNELRASHRRALHDLLWVEREPTAPARLADHLAAVIASRPLDEDPSVLLDRAIWEALITARLAMPLDIPPCPLEIER